jgi:phage terminase small subunit
MDAVGIVGPKDAGARMTALAADLRLTDKQRTFADALIASGNQTEAARVAKLGKDDVSCAVQGSKMVRVPKVAAYLAAGLATARAIAERRSGRRIMEAAEVLERLSEHAEVDVAEFVTVEHPPTLAEQAPHEQKGEQPVGPTWHIDIPKAIANGKSHLIKEISYDSNGLPKLKLVDSQSALDKLAKYHKLYGDNDADPNRTVNVTLVQVLQQNLPLAVEMGKALLSAGQVKEVEGGKRVG